MLEESKKMVVDADTRLGKTVADLRDLVVSPLSASIPLVVFPIYNGIFPGSCEKGSCIRGG